MPKLYGAKKKSRPIITVAGCKRCINQLLHWFNPRVLILPLLAFLLVVAMLCGVALKLSDLEPVDMMENFTDGGHWNGTFEINSVLTNIKTARALKVHGPRCLVYDIGNQILFVGQVDGTVLAIEMDKFGRPGMGEIKLVSNYPGNIVGLRLNMGMLYVADSINGIYLMELSSMKRWFAMELNQVDPPVKSLMDFTIAAGGYLYVVDSSNKYPAHKYMEQFLEGSCTGRLFRFSPLSKKVKMIKTDLCMPTGIEVTFAEDGLLVSESGRGRIMVYDLDNSTVKSEIYLPGIPGRIRLNRRGGYWMAMQAVDHDFMWFVNSRPWLRKILCFLLPQSVLRMITFTPHNVAVDLHTNGTAMDSLHDPLGQVNDRITDLAEAESEVLFFGNDNQNYMGTLGDSNPAQQQKRDINIDDLKLDPGNSEKVEL